MRYRLLSGIFAVAIGFGALSAQAATVNESAVGQAGRGALVQMVEAREISDASLRRVATVAPPSSRANEQAANYYRQDSLLTLALAAMGAIALAFAAVFGRRLRGGAGEEGLAGWRKTLTELVEADLASIDGLTHGLPRR